MHLQHVHTKPFVNQTGKFLIKIHESIKLERLLTLGSSIAVICELPLAQPQIPFYCFVELHISGLH